MPELSKKFWKFLLYLLFPEPCKITRRKKIIGIIWFFNIKLVKKEKIIKYDLNCLLFLALPSFKTSI